MGKTQQQPIDFDGLNQAIEEAAALRIREKAETAALRAEHADALQRLESLREELAAIAAVIEEYEDDTRPTRISAEQFTAALDQQRALLPQVRRAEAEQKRASQAWQDSERQASTAAQGRKRGILAEFDRQAAAYRDQVLYPKLQAQI